MYRVSPTSKGSELHVQFQQLKPHTSRISHEALRQDLARLERLAHALDTQFQIPGTAVRFGWDSILGLFPILGGLVTVVPAGLQLSLAGAMGARHRVFAQLIANKLIDFFIGGIPVFGDVFDVFFKCNWRNYRALKAEYDWQCAKALTHAQP